MAKWRTVDGQKRRAARLLRDFGITEAEYDAIFIFQTGGCAICRRPPKKLRLAVDHDHHSGLVRGLLCMACNRGLERFHDDPFLLRRAVIYLERPPAVRALNAPRYGVRGRVTLSAAGRKRALRFVRKV